MTKDDIIRMAREAGFADGVAEIAGLEGFANFFADNKKALEAALAQQEQEPVAWLQIGLGPLHAGDVIARTTKPKKWNPEWWRFEPLYTTPPAAKPEQRKPLTGGEIYTAYITAANQTLRPQDERIAFAFARAIEAAHNIKEGT